MTRTRDIEGIKRQDRFFAISPDKIEIDPGYNIRAGNILTDSEDDTAFIESIRESGIKVPLMVRKIKDSFVLVQGHRRHAAVTRLISEGVEITSIPCFLEPSGTSEVDRVIDLFLSNSGKPLSPLEQANGIKRLLDYGWTNEAIAKRLGWSVSTVLNRIMLLEAPEAVKRMVAEGEVSASRAIAAIRENGAEDAAQVMREEGPARRGRPRKAKPETEEEESHNVKTVADLTRKDVQRLVNALRWITRNDPNGGMAAHANDALDKCGILGNVVQTGITEGNESEATPHTLRVFNPFPRVEHEAHP